MSRPGWNRGSYAVLVRSENHTSQRKATVQERSADTLRASRLTPSAVALIVASGVMVVSAAYTAGRLGHASSPWVDRLYWVGQALIVVPVAVRLLVLRPLTNMSAAALIGILTTAEYITKICYSPAMFTYADELEHWRSTENLLHTGKLFTANYILPISPHYPGLEEVTAAVVSLTGLSVFSAGLVVAGISHLVFIFTLYLVFRCVAQSYRIAGIAVLFYSTNLDLPFFDSFFAYQTLAVAFFGLCLLAAWHASRPSVPRRWSWVLVALISLLSTVLTHHVTSYMLVLTLMLITLTCIISGGWRAAAFPAILGCVAAIAIICWVTYAASETVGYLRPVVENVVESARALTGAGQSSSPSVPTGPLSDRVLAAGAVLTTSCLLPVGWWQVVHRYRDQPWIVAMGVGSVSWYGILAVRLFVADGGEFAGRAGTFIFVPVGFVLALAVAHLAGTGLRWQASALTATAITVALLLLFDGLANSWPPYWERIPGSYQVAGFERSVDPQVMAAANWTLDRLGPGNRFAADFGSYSALGGYGDQNPVYDDAYLFTSRSFTPTSASEVRAESIAYVLVDRRLSTSLPEVGHYFPGSDPGPYRQPLALSGLTKFDSIPGVSREYDAGDIVIYFIGKSQYYESR